ncbi:hypothetical protein EB001_24190 [bacterium]|nr:hypothetical protein [bacterium]
MSSTVKKKEVTIKVQNLAGREEIFDINDNHTVGDLKRDIMARSLVECQPEYQKLMMIPEQEKSNNGSSKASSSNAPTHTVLDDDSRTVLSYNVVDNTTLHIICNMKYLIPKSEFNIKKPGRMAISPDNQKIYIVSDSTIKILNTLNGSIDEINFANDAHPIAHIISVCLSPDGKYLFIGNYGTMHDQQPSIQKRHAYNGDYISSINPDPERGGYIDVAWGSICISSDGEFLFVWDNENKVVEKFNASDDNHIKTIHTPEGIFNPHARDMQLCISRDNELFILERSSKSIIVLQEDGTLLRIVQLEIKGIPVSARLMDISPDGKYMYIGDRHNHHVIYVFNAYNGSHLETESLPEDTYIIHIRTSPDGDFVFISTSKDKIIQYDTPGITMGGKRYKKHGMRRKHRKSRARRLKKRGTKRKQRK